MCMPLKMRCGTLPVVTEIMLAMINDICLAKVFQLNYFVWFIDEYYILAYQYLLYHYSTRLNHDAIMIYDYPSSAASSYI